MNINLPSKFLKSFILLLGIFCINAMDSQAQIKEILLPAPKKIVLSTMSGKSMAATPNAIYSNLTFIDDVIMNTGAEKQGNNIITKLLADSLVLVGTPPFNVTQFSFTVFNLNAVAISARPRIRFYMADGVGGGPGTAIAGYSFNPISFDSRSPLVFNGSISDESLIITENKVWMGITFDNADGTTGATLAQMNNLGGLIINPAEIGSSNAGLFETKLAGSFFSNNPAGSVFEDDEILLNLGFELVAKSAVPVTLNSFTAAQNGNSNLLKWQTSQESNSSYFGIERSNDGSNFVEVGRVNAAGNSSLISNYQFTDKQPVNGTNFYRLRVVDKDHSFKFSEVVSVKNTVASKLNLYPNPAKSMVTVELQSVKAEGVQLSVTNAAGAKVISMETKLINGLNKINVDVSKLPNGIYYLNIQSEGRNEIQKFSKL